MMVRQLKLKKALPVLEARLGRDHLGFAGFVRDLLEATIKELKEARQQAARDKHCGPAQAKRSPSSKNSLPSSREADELISQIAELKQKRDQADQTRRAQPARRQARAGRTKAGAERSVRLFAAGFLESFLATIRCSSSRSVQTAILSPYSPSASAAIGGSPSRSWRTTSAAERATCQRLHSIRRWGEWLAISGTSRAQIDAGDFREQFDHLGDASFPEPPLGLVVHGEESLDGRQQAHDFFLADFHAAADAHLRD